MLHTRSVTEFKMVLGQTIKICKNLKKLSTLEICPGQRRQRNWLSMPVLESLAPAYCSKSSLVKCYLMRIKHFLARAYWALGLVWVTGWCGLQYFHNEQIMVENVAAKYKISRITMTTMTTILYCPRLTAILVQIFFMWILITCNIRQGWSWSTHSLQSK